MFFFSKAAPTRASSRQAICANKFAQIAWRLLQTVQACGASLQVAQATVWIFLTPSWNTLLLNFFYITYFFSTFRYFSLYLFSNLAFCSFFLFLLLHSVLVTHHSVGSDLYSSINSINNCYSSAVPLEDITRLILLQITTAGTTTRCQLRVILRFVCANKHSDGASIGCLRKKYQTVLISRKQLAQARKQHPTLSSNLRKHSVCANCLHV